jgi:TonB family protein
MNNIFPLILLLAFAEVGLGQAVSNTGAPQLALMAERGNILAQVELGSLYADGRGVAQDYIQSYMWLTLSISGAVDEKTPFRRSQAAVDLQKSIASKMTPPQIEEAERLARDWESRYEQRMGNGPYTAGWGVATPKDISRPSPSYTDRARQARVNGIVVVEFVVHKDGTVGNCKILRGLGYGLDESAIQTITTRWRFQPGTFKGKPVDVVANTQVTFRLY